MHPCDPHQSPGRVILNLTSPLHTHWHPLDDVACPPLPAYLPALWALVHGPNRPLPSAVLSDYSPYHRSFHSSQRSIPPSLDLNSSVIASIPEDPLAFLRLRRSKPPTVLIYGDSVDRNALVHFCQLLKTKVSISHYHDIDAHPRDSHVPDLSKAHGANLEGWDQRGLPHLCEVPFHSYSGEQEESTVAMRIVNAFHYGMDDLEEFNTPSHPDWHAPGGAEERLEQLVIPLIEQMGGSEAVDLVMLHSGMWDLVRFNQLLSP